LIIRIYWVDDVPWATSGRRARLDYLGCVKAFSFNEPWVNGAVQRLLGLSASTRRAIIRILEGSLPPKEDPEEEEEQVQRRLATFWSSFGAWEGDGTAEELAASIRNARTINPDREPF